MTLTKVNADISLMELYIHKQLALCKTMHSILLCDHFIMTNSSLDLMLLI